MIVKIPLSVANNPLCKSAFLDFAETSSALTMLIDIWYLHAPLQIQPKWSIYSISTTRGD